MSRFNDLVSLAFLLLLGLHFALPLAGPLAFELDPLHTHVVIGTSDPRQIAEALAAHRHSGTTAHTHPRVARAGSSRILSVISLPTPSTGRVTLGLNAGLVFATAHSPLALPPDCLWQVDLQGALFPAGWVSTPPCPPPIVSS
jgi:hypothetical protein